MLLKKDVWHRRQIIGLDEMNFGIGHALSPFGNMYGDMLGMAMSAVVDDGKFFHLNDSG